MCKSLLIIIFFCFQNINLVFTQYSIIPEPVNITYSNSNTLLTRTFEIKADDNLNFESAYLNKLLLEKGFTISNKSKRIKIELKLNKNKSKTEDEYQLSIKDGKVKIEANSPRGVFYGIQTLLQILPDYADKMNIKDAVIVDKPRFSWRGLMLDVSRHFFTVEEVKAYIDQMVKYKFNVFHWHLTDDNGWRIEIKSLPKLTGVGAWRVQRYGKYNVRKEPQPGEEATYGGYYTQEQIKDVISYAKDRHITIVPEIDVPGHSMAMLAAYPELSTKKEPKYVNPGTKFSEWYGNGTFKMLIENTLNPVDEKVYETLDKIFNEVAMLFPGQYIHAGGDEAYHGFWEEDEACKKFMKEHNMKDGVELQSYFMKRVEKIISSKGKKMIGWDEILEGGIAEGAAVMSWRGMKGGIEAASNGHKVVMSPTTYAYLDYSQGDHTLEFPIYADLTLKKSYEFVPVPIGINENMILGVQGNLWTEQIQNLSHAYYMTYPRALSLAETAWSMPDKKNWDRFLMKVEKEVSEFDKNEKQICKAFRDPHIIFKKNNGKVYCELSCEVNNTEIYYTIDQSFPDKKSTMYKEPFVLPEGEIQLRAITYKDGKPYGRLLNLDWDEISKRLKK